MSHVMNGNAANGVPAGLTVPSDGDGPGIKAADVNPAFQGLLDGEAYLLSQATNLQGQATTLNNLVLQMPVLNFTRATVSGSFSTAAWNPTQQGWYGVGASAAFITSADGITWSTIPLNSSASESLTNIAIDPSGNMLIASLTRYAFDVPRSAANAKRDVFASAVTLASAKALYDNVHSKWLVLGLVTGTGVLVRSSPDRVAWTAGATNSGAWTSSTTRFDADVSPFTGRIVGMALVGTNVVPATSDDDGATWTPRSSFTPSIAGGSFSTSSLVADPGTSGTWFYTIGGAGTGLCASSIYKSTDDGVTWTLLKSFTNTCVRKLVRFSSSLLIGYGNVRASSVDTSSGGGASTIVSFDGGATWLKSNQFIGVADAGIDLAVGDGQTLIAGTNTMYCSFRYGRSTTVAT